MKSGFIYLTENKSMPGIIKIGYSQRPPEYRIKELSNTSLPHQFTLIYYCFVDDARELESKIHKDYQIVSFT
jgi:hypothetical protein